MSMATLCACDNFLMVVERESIVVAFTALPDLENQMISRRRERLLSKTIQKFHDMFANLWFHIHPRIASRFSCIG